jgi:hypothetical protein
MSASLTGARVMALTAFRGMREVPWACPTLPRGAPGRLVPAGERSVRAGSGGCRGAGGRDQVVLLGLGVAGDLFEAEAGGLGQDEGEQGAEG